MEAVELLLLLFLCLIAAALVLKALFWIIVVWIGATIFNKATNKRDE